MDIIKVVGQVREVLRQQGRLSYRIVRRQFALDEAALEDVKFELIEVQAVAVDQDGKMLVWTGTPHEQPAGSLERTEAAASEPQRALHAEAERRQLTVMFCDVVDSTALSQRLDPEELREVVRAYQDTCTAVIRRYEGHIAQHLGDGLLVYFGYPLAHEDDAQRAVRAGLEIIEALHGQGKREPLQVRIGIHTGLVVIGEIGSSEKREILALGETPNLAARVQGVTAPDTVAISAVTQHLVQGLFEYRELGAHSLKGIETPLSLYQVVREEAVHSRFEVAVRRGLTPLVGREHEVGLLVERWERAKQAEGQVVLLGGEPGIGKSRLVQVVREQAERDAALRLEFRCSPYHQNSAFYPILEHLQRLLQFTPNDSAADGVPLFVEELTKVVLEAEPGGGARAAVPVSLAIPATLHDSLMARLDRLGAAKEVAQLGATLGREFSHELLQAISPVDEETLQRGLSQLVEAELIHQRGMPPHRQYIFKHSLIQDTAYQSLLKSRRQQLHQKVAQVLVEQFPETQETQPELVAYHYTEASLITQAIPYWHQAGQKAIQRSANLEAIRHLTEGLELLKTLPDTPERIQQELMLQLTLGVPLVVTKGWVAPEVEKVLTRTRELCQHIGETPQRFPVLPGRQLASYVMMPNIVLGPVGNILFYNEPAELMLGARFDEIGELSMEDWTTQIIVTDEQGTPFPPAKRPIVIAITERRPAYGELWFEGLDHVRRHVKVAAFPLIGQAERYLGAVSVFWEVKA